jgi:hypothetical protein
LTVLEEDEEEEESLYRVSEIQEEDKQREAGDNFDAKNESFRQGINSSTVFDINDDKSKAEAKMKDDS